ncbi:MAG: hypothetical protein WBQ75_19235 [Acetobacteraceae bacterium]
MFLRAFLAAVSGAAFLALAAYPTPATADAVGGPVLGPALSYLLLGTPGAPGYVGADPEVFVALNPQPLPPGLLPPSISLDLSNPFAPVYTNPTLNVSGDYSAVFGIANGVCSVPYGPPAAGDPGHFAFEPPDPCMPFRINLDVIGPTGPVTSGELIALNPQPLPPGRFSLAELNFSQGGLPDSMMTFSLDFIPPGGGAPIPFSFTPIPEPAGLMILGLGLAALAIGRAGRSSAVR